MFNCGLCKTPTGPKVSPIFSVLQTREQTYFEVREGEIAFVGAGYETVKEIKVCPACAGVDVPTPKVNVGASLGDKASNKMAIQHAQKPCKKALDECALCQLAMRFYATLPYPILAELLQDKLPPIRGFSMASLALSSIIDKTHHSNKRASADIKAGYKVLAPFANRGGGI